MNARCFETNGMLTHKQSMLKFLRNVNTKKNFTNMKRKLFRRTNLNV